MTSRRMSSRSEDPTPTIELRTRIAGRDAGRSLLDFLCARFPYHSRDVWRGHIESGAVTVDGDRAAPHRALGRGAVVAYRKHHVEPPAPTAVAVLHDADGIVVVDKPAGLPCHADGAFLRRTLVAVVEQRLGVRPRMVQRLDRETSGVCTLARDRDTARALHSQLAADGFHKVYLALVRGVVAADHALVDLPIGRVAGGQVSIRRAVGDRVQAPQPACTEVDVLARGADVSLVRCRPRTGRTHQIRVHLAALGHPVLGDKLYGRTDEEFLAWVAHAKAGGAPDFDGRCGAPRQMLHAVGLSFAAPHGGRPLAFVAPVPADFVAAAADVGLACPAAAVVAGGGGV